MGKSAETKSDIQVGLAVAQGGSVALAALPRRPVSAGFHRTQKEEKDEDIQFFNHR